MTWKSNSKNSWEESSQRNLTSVSGIIHFPLVPCYSATLWILTDDFRSGKQFGRTGGWRGRARTFVGTSGTQTNDEDARGRHRQQSKHLQQVGALPFWNFKMLVHKHCSSFCKEKSCGIWYNLEVESDRMLRLMEVESDWMLRLMEVESYWMLRLMNN